MIRGLPSRLILDVARGCHGGNAAFSSGPGSGIAESAGRDVGFAESGYFRLVPPGLAPWGGRPKGG